MDDLIKQGAAAFYAGDLETAKKLMTEVVKHHPDNKDAWSWLYTVCTSEQDRILCLKNLLRINPENEKALEILKYLVELEPAHEKPKLNINKFLKQHASAEPVVKKEQVRLTNRGRIFMLSLAGILIVGALLLIVLLSGQLSTPVVSSESQINPQIETIKGFADDRYLHADLNPKITLLTIPITIKNPREISQSETAQLTITIANNSDQPLAGLSIALVGKSATINYFSGINIIASDPQINTSTAEEDSIIFFKESLNPGENWELALDLTAAIIGKHKGKLLITFNQKELKWVCMRIINTTIMAAAQPAGY
jgi:hypothetical protein